MRAGLLDREQRGKWAWFRICPEGLAAIRAALGDNPTTSASATTAAAG
jgi:hypothetical protein